MVESAFKESKLKFKFKKHRSWLASELFLIFFSPVGKDKVSCKHCALKGVQSHYDNASKFSKSHHRRKYECGLPQGKGHPPRKHLTDAARKEAARTRKRTYEAKRKAKRFAAKKVQPVPSSSKVQPILSSSKVQPVLSSQKVQPVASSPKVQPVASSPKVQPVASSPKKEGITFGWPMTTEELNALLPSVFKAKPRRP
jgi:hypothetical protein